MLRKMIFTALSALLVSGIAGCGSMGDQGSGVGANRSMGSSGSVAGGTSGTVTIGGVQRERAPSIPPDGPNPTR